MFSKKPALKKEPLSNVPGQKPGPEKGRPAKPGIFKKFPFSGKKLKKKFGLDIGSYGIKAVEIEVGDPRPRISGIAMTCESNMASSSSIDESLHRPLANGNRSRPAISLL